MTGARQKIAIVSVTAVAAVALLYSFVMSLRHSTGQAHVMTIEGMSFKPAKVQIARGDSITWINHDILMHAVKSYDPKNAWQSKDLKPHDSWTRSFNEGGSYLCPYHPTMTGEIILSADPKIAGR